MNFSFAISRLSTFLSNRVGFQKVKDFFCTFRYFCVYPKVGFILEFPTPGAKPPDAPGPPPPLRGRGRGIEAPRPPGAGDFLSETPGDAGAILLHKLGNFLLLSHIFQSNYRNNTMF